MEAYQFTWHVCIVDVLDCPLFATWHFKIQSLYRFLMDMVYCPRIWFWTIPVQFMWLEKSVQYWSMLRKVWPNWKETILSSAPSLEPPMHITTFKRRYREAVQENYSPSNVLYAWNMMLPGYWTLVDTFVFVTIARQKVKSTKCMNVVLSVVQRLVELWNFMDELWTKIREYCKYFPIQIDSCQNHRFIE